MSASTGLRFLGIGSAFNPAMENSNAYFVSEGTFYLLDCGETAFGKVWNLPEYVESVDVVVLLTHLHADHSGSLGSLISYSHYVAGKPVSVVHPLDTVVRFLDLIGIERSCYCFAQAVPGESMPLQGGVSVTPLEVEHVSNMRCFGYLVESPRASANCFYFSGDAKTVPDEVLAGLADGGIEAVYQDTSSHESDHPTHATLPYLESIIAPEFRARVFCMHLDYDYRALIEGKGFRSLSPER